MSRFNHGNNSQRFDLYTFYARIIKGKIVELLDKDGNTPFDSDTIDNSVWDYAAQLYADMQQVGILPYFDSENFRQDSDGSGSNNWNSISRTQAEAKVLRPLRRFLYSLDSEEGISSDNEITSGFSRNYYSAPMTDSDGTLRHVNIYSILKSHFDRWIRYDSFERQKLTTLVIDNLNEDSDIRYKFGDNFCTALEEDSDLSRRVVEFYSNVLQSDSDEGHSPRQEYIQAVITGLRGLTPGGDSDEAVRLGHVITAVLNNNSDSDSDIRNKFAWMFIKSLRFDSEQADSDLQNRLRDIISSTELTYLETPTTTARKVMPMDSDDTGTIGDSEKRFALGNFTTVRTDTLKVRSADKDRIIYVSDSEGLLSTNSGLQYQGDSEVVVSRINVNTDSRFSTMRISDLDYEGIVHTSLDSDGRQITNTNARYNDSDGLILFGRNQMAYDSEKWWNYVLENIGVFTIDSEDVRDIMRETHVLSENNFPIGQRGNVYFINEDPDDSENITIYDSELDSYFADAHSGNLNWTSQDATYGNMIDMYSPYGNIYKEANTTKPGGFTGATDITFEINGFGYNGFILVPTDSSYESSNVHIDGIPSTSGGDIIFRKSVYNSGGFYVYFQNGDGATSGDVYIWPWWDGVSGSVFTMPGVTANYYGGSYPLKFRIGRDTDGSIWVQTIGDGSTNTTTESLKYYLSSGLTLTSTKVASVKKTDPNIGIQYAYGNYDQGAPEKMTNIIVREVSPINNQSNKLATRDLVFVSDKIVDTSTELNRALGDVTTKQQVFNTWYRFSHQYNSGGATFNYPANASEATTGWAYDSGTDTIYTTINSTTYAGFVSPDTYDDYTLKATFNAPYSGYANTDDDTIGFVVGFVTEGIKGQPGYREHTLSFIRTAGGFPMTDQGYGNVTWALVYNYNQDDVRLLVNGTNFGTASTGITIGGSNWSNFANGTRVEIRRKGDSLVGYCSQMNTTTIDSDTEITFDLSSDSDTIKFRGPVSYGYSAHSQQGSYWSSIFFAPDVGSYLHDLSSTIDGSKYENDEGGNVYEYDNDAGVWTMDSDLTVYNTIGRNRLAHNKITGKTFVPNTSTNLVNQVMTSRKFSDVIHLPALSSEPDSELLGNLGLRPGTIARADGVSWDPKSKGGSTPYFVFYSNDSDGWFEMVTS